MNRKVLLMAAMAGMLAGLAARALRFIPEPRSGAAMSVGARNSPPGVDGAGGEAVRRDWERRFSQYMEGARIPVSLREGDMRSEMDTVLRLLDQPVDAAVMEEGVALLNRLGSQLMLNHYSAVFERWAAAGPETALAAVDKLRGREARGALVYEVFRRYALDGQLDSALAGIGGWRPGVARAAACKALAETLPSDRIPDRLRQEMSTGPVGALTNNASFAASLLDRLFTLDPEAPLRLALETDHPGWRAELLTQVMERGAKSVENNSNAWNETLVRLAGDPRNREGVQSALHALVSTDPEQALRIVATYPSGEARSMHRAWLAGVDPQIPHLEELGWSPEEREEKIQNHQTIMDTVRELEGTEGFNALLAEAALSGGTGTLQAVGGWLAFRGDSAALEDLTRRATLAEPLITARWLAALPPSPERDRAVAAFAETHAAVDPERAAGWAASIADPAKRESTLLSLRKKAPEAR